MAAQVVMSGMSSSSDAHVRLTRGASYLIVQNLGVSALTIVSFAILSRLISTKEVGIWAVLGLINATLYAFATWFPQAVTKYVAENKSKGSISTAAAAYYKALTANLVIYLPVVAVIYFGAPFLASHLLRDASYASSFQILAFDTFFNGGALPIIMAALLGLQMFRETAVVGLAIGGFFRQILIILLVVLMRNFVGLVIGWLVSDAAMAVIYLFYTIRVFGAPRFDFPLRTLFRYYLPLEFQSITIYAQSWFDRILLVGYVPLATLGIYNAAVTAFGVTQTVAGSVSSMLFSGFSSIQNQTQSRSKVRESIRLVTRYASFTMTPIAFGLLATAKPSLALFVGESYASGSLPLVILCTGDAITAFATGLGSVLLALGETMVAGVIGSANVIVSLAVGWVLVQEWGIVGVSVARAVSQIIGPGLVIFMLRRWRILDLDFGAIAKTFVAGTTMAIVLLAVQLVEYSKFMLPLYVLIGAVVYLVMLRLLKAVEVDDLNLLQRFLGKRLSRVGYILRWILLHSD